MNYYVSLGLKYDASGRRMDMYERKFTSLVAARKYGYQLLLKHHGRTGYGKTSDGRMMAVGTVVYVYKKPIDNPRYDDYKDDVGVIQKGQPNMSWPIGIYWRTDSREHGAFLSHWAILNKDGTLGKRYR